MASVDASTMTGGGGLRPASDLRVQVVLAIIVMVLGPVLVAMVVARLPVSAWVSDVLEAVALIAVGLTVTFVIGLVLNWRRRSE